MRFSSLLFALPLVGSVLGAPLATVEKKDLAPALIAERDLDVISILADVEAKVAAIVPGAGSVLAVADVHAHVDVIVGALGHCLDLLSVHADIAAFVGIHAHKRELETLETRGLDVNQVANILVQITAHINVFILAIPKELLDSPEVAPLLKTVDGLLVTVFGSVKILIPTILNICAHIFVALHINISGVLGGVLGLVGGLIADVLAIVGGLPIVGAIL